MRRDNVLGEPLIVYDGDCSFCEASVGLARRRLPRLPLCVPWQTLDLHAIGLSRAQVEREVVLLIRGETFGGAHAVGALLRRAGGPWRLLGLVMQAPPFGWLASIAYRVVARNRGRIRLGGGQSA